MLTEDIKFHPYKVQLIQALNEDDKPRRVEFARHQLEAIEQDPNFANRIFFTDEAHFHLKGTSITRTTGTGVITPQAGLWRSHFTHPR